MENNIRKLRESKGLTQEELGKLIGAEKETVYRHEKGIIKLTEKKIIAYAKALDCSPAEIISSNKQRLQLAEVNPEILAQAIKEILEKAAELEVALPDEKKYKLISDLYNKKIREHNNLQAKVTLLHKEVDK